MKSLIRPRELQESDMAITRLSNGSIQKSREADRNAQEIRCLAQFDSEETIDAHELAARLGFRVLTSDDLTKGLAISHGSGTSELSAKEWSAFLLPDIKTIAVNSNQTPERIQASIMEEVAHDFLGHKPSQITLDDVDGASRTRNDGAETSAYWTGAAVLLPGSWIAKSIWNGISVNSMAVSRGVSRELVEFRIKTLGLWTRSIRDQKE